MEVEFQANGRQLACEERPLVSVVVATYNMGKYISEAVRSIISQDYPNLEVIVVDDGSTDCTQAVLKEFAGDSRVVIVRQENRGQPVAKNVGLKSAGGTFVAFCDADDYWLPNKLSLQMPRFNERPTLGVVYSKTTVLDVGGKLGPSPEQVQPKGRILSDLFLHNHVPFGTAVVRRECLDQVGGFDETIPMGIDWDLWLRIACRWEFEGIPESTYVYRVWPGQMSHNWRGRYQCALQIMRKFLEANPESIPKAIVDRAFADTFANYALASFCQDRAGLRDGYQYLLEALKRRPSHLNAWRVLFTHPIHRRRSLRRSADGE